MREIQATVLRLLGLDPWKHSYAFQGLDQRLIRPEGNARVLQQLIR